MQVGTNIINFEMLLLPSNSRFILEVMLNVSQFRLLEAKFVKDKIKGIEFMKHVDELTIAFVLFLILIGILATCIKFIKVKMMLKILNFFKKRLIYSFILRPFIQYYLLTTITAMQVVKTIIDSEGESFEYSALIEIGKLLIMIMMPYFSYKLLVTN